MPKLKNQVSEKISETSTEKVKTTLRDSEINEMLGDDDIPIQDIPI